MRHYSRFLVAFASLAPCHAQLPPWSCHRPLAEEHRSTCLDRHCWFRVPNTRSCRRAKVRRRPDQPRGSRRNLRRMALSSVCSPGATWGAHRRTHALSTASQSLTACRCRRLLQRGHGSGGSNHPTLRAALRSEGVQEGPSHRHGGSPLGLSSNP